MDRCTFIMNRCTFIMDRCTLMDFQKIYPFIVIIKLGRAKIFYNSDCVHLKEESHIHLGWVQCE